jgi:hypothetical protein
LLSHATSLQSSNTTGGTTIRSIDTETGVVNLQAVIYGEKLDVSDIMVLDDGKIALTINYYNMLEFNNSILSTGQSNITSGAFMILNSDLTLNNYRLIHNPTVTSNTNVTCDRVTTNYAERELLIYGTSQGAVQMTDPGGSVGFVKTTQQDKYLTYVMAYDI